MATKPSSRTRSANSARRLDGCVAARERSREQPPQSASGNGGDSSNGHSLPGSSRGHRPRSAQPRPGGPAAVPSTPPTPVGRAPRAVAGGGLELEKVLRSMRAHCQELKEAANYASHEKKLLSTRQMALDRELQRRERLLRTMMQLQKAGQGLGMDLIEKLREERNMLPIYQKKLQDLQAYIGERESEIINLKHDERFTRIIELQVEYASWQHEVRRLQSLLEESSPEQGVAMQKELEVHQSRVILLKEQLEQEDLKQGASDQDFENVQECLRCTRSSYEAGKADLASEQQAMHSLVDRLQGSLLQRKELEQLEVDIHELGIFRSKLDQELGAANQKMGQIELLQPAELKPHQLVSESIVRGKGYPLLCSKNSSKVLHRTLACRDGYDPMRGALIVQLLALDVQSSGCVSSEQLEIILEHTIGDACAGRELVSACAAAIRAGGGTVDHSAVRWLDCLLALDRLGGGSQAVPAPRLPELLPVRVCCLRSGCSAETFRARLLEVRCREDVTKLFGRGLLGLGDAQTTAWADLWQALGGGGMAAGDSTISGISNTSGSCLGSVGLLARLPLDEVAMPQLAHDAWLVRCRGAVRKEVQDLKQFFGQFPDMHVPEGRFSAICRDVLGAELSADDIDDLRLWAKSSGDDGYATDIDGAVVLRLGQS